MSGVQFLDEFLASMAAVRRDALPRLGGEYVCVEDLVLREGQVFPFAPYDLDRWGPPGRPRHCFANALLLATTYPEQLVYVEGYADWHIPTHHAWTVDVDTGLVVDPTWTGEATYRGLPLDLAFVDETTTVRGKYGVLDDWENDWPLLQTPLDRALLDLRAAGRIVR